MSVGGSNFPRTGFLKRISTCSLWVPLGRCALFSWDGDGLSKKHCAFRCVASIFSRARFDQKGRNLWSFFFFRAFFDLCSCVEIGAVAQAELAQLCFLATVREIRAYLGVSESKKTSKIFKNHQNLSDSQNPKLSKTKFCCWRFAPSGGFTARQLVRYDPCRLYTASLPPGNSVSLVAVALGCFYGLLLEGFMAACFWYTVHLLYLLSLWIDVAMFVQYQWWFMLTPGLRL